MEVMTQIISIVIGSFLTAIITRWYIYTTIYERLDRIIQLMEIKE